MIKKIRRKSAKWCEKQREKLEGLDEYEDFVEIDKINDNCSHKLYVADDGNDVWIIPCKHEDGEGHVWYTYHIGKMNNSSDRQFNTWNAFVDYMIEYKAIEYAKNAKKVA